MSTIPRCALALAAVALCTPAAAVYPHVDFEWYASVGRQAAMTEVFPAPRAGLTWAPGHYQNTATGQAWVAGRWIKDDYDEQVALYASRPLALYDADGVPIRR